MKRSDWNHNTHYHGLVLKSVPPNCQSALDAGCGQGLLARKLAARAARVTGIDVDPQTLRAANAASEPNGRITFVEGDVMTHPFGDAGFDFIAAVAALHHLPLRPALKRFRDLLAPGGVLILIGLYRMSTIQDVGFAAAALPVSRLLRLVRGCAEVTAPLQTPRESLGDIQSACRELIPGHTFRRRLLFRYSVVWHKA